MTVYELIQELCKHDPDQHIEFFLEGYFHVEDGENLKKASYNENIELVCFENKNDCLRLNFTN